MLIKLLILSVISGILYRLGGWEKGNTKFRDIGCPLVAVLSLWLLHGAHWNYWWAYLLIFGLMFLALTTYWDKLFKEDNFYMHGYMIGLSTFPLIWLGIHWYIIMIYSILLAITMGLWSKWIKRDWLEEFGRGFLLCWYLRIFATR